MGQFWKLKCTVRESLIFSFNGVAFLLRFIMSVVLLKQKTL